MQNYNSRQEVPEKYKFDLSEIFKDFDEYDKAYIKAKELIAKVPSYKGKLKDPKELYKLYKLNCEIYALIYRLEIYVIVLNDVELGNSELLERLDKAYNLSSEFNIAISYMCPEILSFTDEEFKNLFTYDKLDEFKSALEDIYREKDHTLPEDKDTIITKLNNASLDYYNASNTLNDTLNNYGTVMIDGVEEKITTTNLRKLLKNEDKEKRKEIYTKFYSVIDQYSPMNALLLHSYVKSCIANSKIHNYKDSWDAKLFLSKMPNEAFEALTSTVEENVDKFQKYLKVFRETLGLDELNSWDMQLDVSKSKKEYTIEEAQEICLEAVKPLGENYVKHFKKIFDNRYIDYACYPGKRFGAYSICGMDFPSRILMSFNYDLDSISTIIHEGGHNVNGQYIEENVPIQYRDNDTICAEVTSLTNECLLSSYMVENGKTKDEKLAALDNILGVFFSNLFSAVREGKMEQEFYNYVNDGNTITKDYMKELELKSIEKYYGDEVKRNEYSGMFWPRLPHYYYNYYLFSYAFSICAASYVASEILNGNEDMRERYMKYLTLGSDTTVIDSYKVLGIDLTDKKVYKKAIDYFDTLIDKFVEIRDEVDSNGK